ncbi:hypothetical protein GDO81_028094 [Engystomops pustulosus]|uniref:Ig-like domain-containing protein n=1 Tax=Engystomops pustulosus TaxID=76066 RepID=A0AAV6ZPZ1_ENGPU|nr:hypothetical protein GDO81_028094 [Engystomops pustulosus]
MASSLPILIFWLLPVCFALKATITQSPRYLMGNPRSEAIMTCEQLTTDHENMYWYYQNRGQGLELVASMLRGQEPDYGGDYKSGYKMDRSRADKHSSLRIQSPAATDQGVYFCASSDAQ